MAVTHVVFLLVSLCVVTNGQVFNWGKCPNVTLQQDFDVTSYMGTWYEITKFPAAFQQMLKCTKAIYQLKDNGHVRVQNEGINELLGTTTAIVGDAYAPDPRVPEQLKIKFFWWQPPGDYWVLRTDYESYAVVYTCTDYFGLSRVEFAWILSRERTLDEDTLASIVTDIESMGIDVSYFVPTDQTECDDVEKEVEIGPLIRRLRP
ncbi:apolipoprotein D-like [Glandiceps talaboti]